MPEALLAQILPTQAEAKQAEETGRVLSSRLRSKTLLKLRLVGTTEDDTLVIPASAAKMLVGILDEMGRGNTVTVIPVHAELTTQEAADMLSISGLLLSNYWTKARSNTGRLERIVGCVSSP